MRDGNTNLNEAVNVSENILSGRIAANCRKLPQN
jgi:hypothetical protein